MLDGLAELAAQVHASHKPTLDLLRQAVDSRRADLQSSTLGPALVAHCANVVERYAACLQSGQNPTLELRRWRS